MENVRCSGQKASNYKENYVLRGRHNFNDIFTLVTNSFIVNFPRKP